MIIKHPFFQNSLCRKHYLHRFEVIRECDNAVLEVCKICHVKKLFKITDDGKTNNKKYLSYHLRQFLRNLPFPKYIRHEFDYDPLSSETISPYI